MYPKNIDRVFIARPPPECQEEKSQTKSRSCLCLFRFTPPRPFDIVTSMRKMGRKEERQRDVKSTGSPAILQQKSGDGESWTTRYGWLFPLLLALLVNANVLLNGFAWDDAVFFGETSHQDAPARAPDAYFRPLIVWSYQLDQWFWGRNPFGFHLSVYLAHALTTLLYYLSVHLLLRFYRKEKAEDIALVTASLFAIHPIHTEAVAWVSGRNDVFTALFMMIALYAYLRHRQQPSSWSMLLLFTLGSVLGLMSKETAIPFLLIFPVIDFLLHRSGVIRWRGIKEPMVWLWAIFLGSFILYRLAQVGRPPAYPDEIPLVSGTKILLIALGYYLKLLFIPHPLNLFVSELPTGDLQGLIYLALGTAGIAVLIWVILRLSRTLFAIGAIWFVLGIAAPLVVPFVPVSVTPVAERYAYLASGGFLLLVSVGGYQGWRWIQARFSSPMDARWGIGCLILIVGLFSYLTVERNGIWRDEVKLWEDTVRKSPPAALPRNYLGSLYFSHGQTEKAVQEFQMALKLEPDNPDVHRNRGVALKKLGRLDESIREYQAALKLKPDDAVTHNDLGLFYQDLGRTDEAVQEYQIALKLKPDDAAAHYNLGNTYKRQGRLGEAIQAYQSALKFKPDSAEAHNNLGNIYKDQGRLDEATREYQAALKLAPNSAWAHDRMGEVLKTHGRLEEAIKEYQTALKLQPDSAEAHARLARVYNDLGRLEEAAQEYQTALKLKQDLAEAHVDLGTVYRRQGRIEQAVQEYQIAIKLKPDSVEAHVNLGIAYRKQKRLEEAVQEYQTALKLKPDSGETHTNLGVVYEDLKRTEQAIQEYQFALKLKPDLVEAHYNLGAIYQTLGRLEKAVQEFQAALKLQPDLIEAYYSLGNIYRRQGRIDEATQSYHHALQLKPDFLPARKALESLSK
ncbi:MAG: tetratricopeptide repeat protein [Nitrospirae bacterium]|nr:tetratricopeptide repeat protein [Nitrospirota bacterium]